MTVAVQTLRGRARAVLATGDARGKAAASRAAAAWWRGAGAPSNDRALGDAGAPDRPGRPARPRLVPPGRLPRRKIGAAPAGRIALLHAIAHIELNAIDLAWDIVARFDVPDLPRAFFDDWVRVGDEEAIHFGLLADRLEALGAAYGDLDAHDGLWQAARDTGHDLAARLAVVPLVLEARGLDVTPGMIARLDAVGDADSVAALERIYADEVGHVAAGKRWFEWVCAARGEDPRSHWIELVRRHFGGAVRPPFNDEARGRAGLPAMWYGALGYAALDGVREPVEA